MENQQVQINIDNETLKGSYANALQVSHSKEEFVMDYMNLFPPQGSVVSRVIVSPSHMKRILSALSENIGKYEAAYGKIEESAAPPQVDLKIN